MIIVMSAGLDQKLSIITTTRGSDENEKYYY